jgi:hypothetical protein
MLDHPADVNLLLVREADRETLELNESNLLTQNPESPFVILSAVSPA